VRLFEVGNEIWGDWVRGHSDATTYASNYLRYARAMKAKDPKIELIAVGDNDMAWNRTLLRAAAREIDYLAVHHYYGNKEMAGDPSNLMARPLYYERFYADVAKLVREEAGGRPLRLSVNEWGLSISEARYYSMEAAVYGARLMNVFERSPNVAMSAESDLVNGWPGGIIQASRHGLFVSPLYYVNQLYNANLGRDRLRTTVDGPTFDTSLEGRGVPALDAVASRSADGSRLFVKLVNTSAAALTTRVELRGAGLGPEAEWHLLAADSPTARTSFAAPDAIRPRREALRTGPALEMTLPARSVSVIVAALAAPSRR
jgi:alpha-N-arabinofuranosidase